MSNKKSSDVKIVNRTFNSVQVLLRHSTYTIEPGTFIEVKKLTDNERKRIMRDGISIINKGE